MKELYELTERLIDELKDYGRKDLSSGTISTIDTLAHATKNLCKIIEDGEYSNRWVDGRSYRRDSMGRYSRDGYSRHGLADKLRELMTEAPDEQTRMEIKRLVDKM
jgi:xylose isomerase